MPIPAINFKLAFTIITYTYTMKSFKLQQQQKILNRTANLVSWINNTGILWIPLEDSLTRENTENY